MEGLQFKITSKLSAKFFEIFRNLKSDAVPRPARQKSNFDESNSNTEAQNENTEGNEDAFVNEQNGKKSKKKPKFKKSFSVPKEESEELPEEEDRRSSTASSNVNTQASGNVINIVNSSKVRCGNEFVYYMGTVYGQPGMAKTPPSDDEEPIEKTNIIVLLLEADIKPEHEYIEYISKHLGRNWHRFFRKLGYKQGQIETAEIDMAKQGVAEARYKLLLDWMRNDEDGTLGKLSNVLWEDGERQIVKEMAAMYSQSNQ